MSRRVLYELFSLLILFCVLMLSDFYFICFCVDLPICFYLYYNDNLRSSKVLVDYKLIPPLSISSVLSFHLFLFYISL